MQHYRIVVEQNGRVTLPAPIRQQLGIEAGQRLRARRDGDTIILEKLDRTLDKLQRRFKAVPGSMAEELIAERRVEAANERRDARR